MKRKNKGITLIEMVAVIVVLGISVPVLLTMWSDVAWRSSRSEAMADAMFYAQQLMEEIKSRRFDENAVSPWSSNLGPDGEAYAAYDDVDDFNGYSETISGTPYNRCVTVDYVTLSGTTWTGNCSPSTPAGCTPPTCVAANRTNYKRIIVTVWRSDNIVSGVNLITMVSGYTSG
jgi:prepilin-type N-terminal cleavage/methylation domain-containing protein